MIGLPAELGLVAAFVFGLLGSVHCLGMCSGIVGAYGASIPSTRSRVPLLLAYNGGRVASYGLAGAAAGLLGAGLLAAMPAQLAPRAGAMIAALFLIALGLYLAGWWRGLARLEQAGAVVWKRIAPLGRRLLPADTPVRAWLFGMVWGWLPCGLVYAVLAWSMTAGSPLRSALLMLAFGAGTLPAMLLAGGAGSQLAHWRRHPRVRQGAGAVLVLFGTVGLAAALATHGPHVH